MMEIWESLISGSKLNDKLYKIGNKNLSLDYNKKIDTNIYDGFKDLRVISFE